jgi:hypothetical protein
MLYRIGAATVRAIEEAEQLKKLNFFNCPYSFHAAQSCIMYDRLQVMDLVIVWKQSKVQYYLRTEANGLSGNPVRTIANNSVAPTESK